MPLPPGLRPQPRGAASRHPSLSRSTLPDSPPDSGSEAYSPQQVNGESSGHRPPPPRGRGKWLGRPYREGGIAEGGGQRCPTGHIIAGQILGRRCPLFPAGGWGASPAPSECPSGDATACPPAPSWMRPSAVSGRLGKASPAARPSSPWGWRGAVASRWPKAEGSRAAVAPGPERGQEFCLSDQTSLECLPGTRAAGLPPQAGGLPGAWWGAPGGCCHRTALGRLLPGAREELGTWGLPQEAGSQPGPVEGAGELG